MKTLSVRKTAAAPKEAAEVPALLDREGVEWQPIGCVNWPEAYPYAPRVAFRMAHTGQQLLIHYRVREYSVAAVAPHDCGRVWEDSCCEFFSVPAADGYYYNMECNCAGTLLVAAGTGREEREHAPQSVLEKVLRWSSLGRRPFAERIGEVEWELALIVPAATYFRHSIAAFDGLTMRANFYKCGDKLSRPHFLSWNPIAIGKPDFHRPDFFGTLVFE